MADPADLRAAIRARIEAATSQDLGSILEPGAVSESRQLEERLGEGAALLESCFLLGWFHWYRYMLLPEGEDRADLSAAIRMFTLCFVAGVQPLPEQLVPVLAEEAISPADALFRDVSEAAPGNLSDVISVCQRLLRILGIDHPGRPTALRILGFALFRRFVETGQAEDLAASIRVGEEAIRLMPTDDPARAAALTDLSRAFQARFNSSGYSGDLSTALDLGTEAVRLMPADHPARAPALTNLNRAFRVRFERMGRLSDLDEGIRVGQEAIRLIPADHPARATALTDLSRSLLIRSEHTGRLSDLDAGIRVGQEAIRLIPADHPARATALTDLSQAFQARFNSTGHFGDLSTALDLGTEAVRLTPADHPARATALTNLSRSLLIRSEHTGQLSDLDAGIGAGEEAVRLIPADHPARATALTNLSRAFRARFERGRQLADLSAAVEAVTEAVRMMPADDPARTAVVAEQESLTRLRDQHASRRLVSTGFASRHDPYQTVEPSSTLQMGQAYLYWFEVSGASAPDAIDSPEHREVPIEPHMTDTPLTVALFGFPGEIETSAGEDVGELILAADGPPRVSRQPAPESLEAAERGRLAFPVRMPSEPGRYRLRCNLYCRQTLLQSRLVEAQVTARSQRSEQALLSTVDFNINSGLNRASLTAIRPLRMSVLLNDNGNGTHGFRFMGENNLKGDAVLDGHELQDLLDRARRTYRRAAWNSEDEWQPGWEQELDRYVYGSFPGEQRLCDDLISMARAGYRLWSRLAVDLSVSLAPQFPRGQSPQRSLREVMRHGPGFVEFASKRSARMVVPASILYDYPLDTNKDLQVCADALSAISSHGDLTSHPCFTGDCPSYDDQTVVCPGGFWGFRHGIGLPQSRCEHVDGQTDTQADTTLADSWPEIRHTEKPGFIIGVADDLRGDHVSQVLELGDSQSRIEDQRDRLLADLRSADFGAHIVYFFCHGALVNGIPALQVGPRDSEGITQDNIEDGSMYWLRTRPLVFLNGCSTAAVEPKYALNLVDAFVRGAFASGVIGTEITVFKSLATQFADEFFAQFLDADEPVGEAVRRARLRALAAGNPLGLVYIAYSAPRLQLIP